MSNWCFPFVIVFLFILFSIEEVREMIVDTIIEFFEKKGGETNDNT